MEHLSVRAQLGGPVTALAADGDRLYIGAGPRLVAWDVSNPHMPRRLGQSGLLPDVVVGIAVWGETAFLALSGSPEVAIVDLSSPATCALRGLARLREVPVCRVAMCGDVLIVSDEGQRLTAYRPPGHPNGQFAALWPKGLHVGQAVALGANERAVAVLTGSRGVRLIDMAEPAQPTAVSTWGSVGSGALGPRWMDLRDDVLYLQHTPNHAPNQVDAIDIQSLEAPCVISSFALTEIDGYPTQLAVTRQHLAVGCSSRGRVTLHPRSPHGDAASVIAQLGEPAIAPGPVAPSGGGAYAIRDEHELALLVPSGGDPSAERVVDLGRRLVADLNIASIRDVAYVTGWNVGLVVDADGIRPLWDSDNSAPHLVHSAAVSGNRLLLTLNGKLAIFEVGHPRQPGPQATLELAPPDAYARYGTTIDGDRLYALDSHDLAIFELGVDPEPKLLSLTPVQPPWPDAYPTVVAVRNGLLAGGALRGGVRLFDVRDPRAARVASSISGLDARDVCLLDEELLVVTDDALIWFGMDQQTHRLRFSGRLPIPGGPRNVRMVDTEFWVTTGVGGLVVLAARAVAEAPTDAAPLRVGVRRVKSHRPGRGRSGPSTVEQAARLAIQAAAEAHLLGALAVTDDALRYLDEVRRPPKTNFEIAVIDESGASRRALERHARQLERMAAELQVSVERFQQIGESAVELWQLRRFREGFPPFSGAAWQLVESGRVFGALVSAQPGGDQWRLTGRVEMYAWPAPHRPFTYEWRLDRKVHVPDLLRGAGGLHLRSLGNPVELVASAVGSVVSGDTIQILEQLAAQLVVVWLLRHSGPDAGGEKHDPGQPAPSEPRLRLIQ